MTARRTPAISGTGLRSATPRIWDADFRDRIGHIREKPIRALSADEINTYLTFIFCTDRTQEGCVEAHIANGVLPALMRRIVELEESK